MRHCPPRMVLGRGLREPDVSRIAGKLAALECAHDRIAIGQLAARGVDQIGTALEALERLVVDHVLGLRMERYVERDDVADAVHLLAAVVPGEAQFRLHLGRQAVAVGIMEVHIEGLQALEHREADAPRSEEHTSELQSLMRISYAVFCLKKKKPTS